MRDGYAAATVHTVCSEQPCALIPSPSLELARACPAASTAVAGSIGKAALVPILDMAATGGVQGRLEQGQLQRRAAGRLLRAGPTPYARRCRPSVAPVQRGRTLARLAQERERSPSPPPVPRDTHLPSSAAAALRGRMLARLAQKRARSPSQPSVSRDTHPSLSGSPPQPVYETQSDLYSLDASTPSRTQHDPLHVPGYAKRHKALSVDSIHS